MNLRYSFSAWSTLKDCPKSYELKYIKKIKVPRDNQNTIQGLIPGKQAEDFFRQPPEARKREFFEETFDKYWEDFVKESTDQASSTYVNWYSLGAKIAHKEKRPMNDATFIDLAFWKKYEESKAASKALSYVLEESGFLLLNAEPEVDFILEVTIPEQDLVLTLVGRMDLLITLSDGREDIWDFKVTKYPTKLDPDQLVLYRLARQHAGKTVRRTGYVLVKQSATQDKEIGDEHGKLLIKSMADSKAFFVNNYWPTNFRDWKCREYCDVRLHCEAAQARGVRT